MDVNMPVMNGIEATKLYRFAELGRKRVPILALTADATPAAAASCREAGMDGCITKPVEPARLLAIITDLVVGQGDSPAAAAPTSERVSDIASHPRFRSASVPVLDETALADLEALGGEEFVGELIDEFVIDAQQLVGELIQAAREGDVQRFRNQAHALRSAAANVGAKSLFELCLSSRNIQRHELHEQSDALVARLGGELSRVRGALLAYRTGLKQARRH
jgi:two-component system sensor histidine kinase RpfC